MSDYASASLALVENALWVLTRPIGISRYDFAFEQYFACQHPIYRDRSVRAVGRMGAADDYVARYEALREENIQLIHTPAEYERTSRLPAWYPLLEDLTPRSLWFDRPPSATDVEATFGWPVFVKGERQTSRHRRSLAILDDREKFERAMTAWGADPLLQWQQVVCREFVSLRLVGEQSNLTLPRSFEFRTFWWHSECVGFGPYWVDEPYQATADERHGALDIAGEAARRINVTFLVVDVAQRIDGAWTVIECNDGQDAGYAGMAPMILWRRVLDLLRSASTDR
jgi:ATP-grasp domain, R2K clade family 3